MQSLLLSTLFGQQSNQPNVKISERNSNPNLELCWWCWWGGPQVSLQDVVQEVSTPQTEKWTSLCQSHLGSVCFVAFLKPSLKKWTMAMLQSLHSENSGKKALNNMQKFNHGTPVLQSWSVSSCSGWWSAAWKRWGPCPNNCQSWACVLSVPPPPNTKVPKRIPLQNSIVKHLHCTNKHLKNTIQFNVLKNGVEG